MKRPVLYLCVLALLLPAAGCQNPFTPDFEDTAESDVGSLVVSIAAAGVKTLLPPIDLTPVSYMITGSGPGGRSFEQIAFSPVVTISKLVKGLWTITVEALNAEGTIVGRGTAAVKVNSRKTVTLQVEVLPLEGFGRLELTVSWNFSDTANPTVTGQLLPCSGTPVDLSFTTQAPGLASCSRADIGAGYYCLTVELRDSGVLVRGVMEVARIVKDQTTSGAFDFAQIDTAAGSIAVNISPPPEDPIAVTLSGQQAALESGAQMTATAIVPPETGNVACAWYLNGITKATGSSFTVGPGLDPGIHRLGVSVFSADGKRAGSAGHQFQVVVPAAVVQAALEWDPNSEPDLAGYRLHYGSSSGSYTTVVDVGKQTAYTLTGLTAGATYYIAATAYNTAGLESAYSNEVVFCGFF